MASNLASADNLEIRQHQAKRDNLASAFNLDRDNLASADDLENHHKQTLANPKPPPAKTNHVHAKRLSSTFEFHPAIAALSVSRIVLCFIGGIFVESLPLLRCSIQSGDSIKISALFVGQSVRTFYAATVRFTMRLGCCRAPILRRFDVALCHEDNDGERAATTLLLPEEY